MRAAVVIKIQDDALITWPSKINMRRLAGLRAALSTKRKLLITSTQANRPKIQKGMNDILAGIATEHLHAGEYSRAYDLFFWLSEKTHALVRCQGMTRCLVRLKQYKDAISLVKNAMKIYSDDTDLRLTYLRALHLMADYEKCLNMAYDSLVLFPDEAAFLFLIAWSYELLKQWDEAEDIYRAFLKENPDDSILYLCIARCLVGKGQAAKAIPVLQRGIRVAPEYSGCYYEMTKVYSALGQFENALKMAKKAFRLFYATEGRAYAFLGMALYNHGERDTAINVLHEGQSMYPNQEKIDELINDIAALNGA